MESCNASIGSVTAIDPIATIRPKPRSLIATTRTTDLFTTHAGQIIENINFVGAGITFNHVHPGRIATDRMIDTAGSLEAAQEQARKLVPAERLGTVEECAAAAVFLCSQPAAYVNGTAILVDGGLTRSV